MNIKDRIRLSVIISLIIVLAISGSIIYTTMEMKNLQYQENLATEVVRGGYELSHLSNEYNLFEKTRTYIQWDESYASLQPVLSGLKPTDAQEEQSILMILESNEEIGLILDEIRQEQESDAGDILLPAADSMALWNRNQALAQVMIFEGLQLRQSYNDDLNEIQFWNNIFIIIFILAMLAIISVNYLLLSRRFVRSIQEINEGTGAFTQGNFDYRIPVTTSDEIGGIACGLNTMAEKIKSVTASRDELNTEIVERRLVEKQLREAHRDLEQKVAERTSELSDANLHLQELDQLKSMFIAAMSHELRTPLNSIIGFTGILLQELPGNLNDEQKKQLSMVKTSAHHLLSLINDVIDISKIGAGKIDYAHQTFDLAPEIREVAAELAGSAEEQSLSLTIDSPEHLEIVSDRRRVRQIIANLVSNAIKFTDEGSVQITLSQEEENARITVHDTGIGIREEEIPRLFKAFSRITTEGRLTEGTGLGLYLSQEIAQALGGKISVTSDYGAGSIFVLVLPLRQKEKITEKEEG
ncbi:sensor histidine kinase [Methanoplanus endosymbiosus]|uniref:histidine kinase n=1 Tax=Methanoplanus endosymbiosus TaxID=33865 RepID=A0A9E7PN25_9EURY|nr:ATP-binding protein [Methanoplanus endosymbiosus]UUX93288.1 ATP-binding protein [Methanoplanus endosymbiosus]